MTDDIVARLLAAIEETERDAREASSSRLPGTQEWVVVEPARNEIRTAGGGHLPGTQVVRWTWPNEAIHIARHDPAAVLRHCAADRKIIEAYVAAQARAKATWENYGAWANNEPEPHAVLPDGPDEKAIPGLLIAVRLLAKGYGLEVEEP